MKNEDYNENKNKEEKFSLNKNTLKFVLAVITFTLLLNWGLNHTADFEEVLKNITGLFSPFIFGACIAFIINTILRPLEKLWNKIPQKLRTKNFDKAKRPVCLTFSVLIVFGSVFAILFMIIPQLVDTITSFANKLPQYVKNITGLIDKLYAFLANHNISLPSINFNWNKIGDFLKNFLDDYADSFINTTVEITTSIVKTIVNFIIAIFFSLYLLAKKERVGKHLSRLVYSVRPKHTADAIIKFSHFVSDTFTKFVTGQLLEAIIIGVLCLIGMLILKLPYAGIISVLIGFTALIPVFGAFIGTGIGAFLILLAEPMKALWFIIFIIVLQQIETNLIYPKVVGKTVGLPGILVLVSVTIGGGAFGIVGMLFSVPVCTVLYCVFKEFTEKRLKGKEIPDRLR
ncbi:MAG: AI-2E family transporter [Ruminococcaceae bacterium]|nr:AI-2E family transporter [Oscillospiraceae bacterium]